MATNLYVGIMTDTGSFRFANTTERTFSISSDLIGLGANPAQIAQQVYMNYREAKVRLLAKVLATLQIHSSREIAWLVLTDEMLSECGASREDTEGIINHALSISGVNLAAFFREESGGSVRVSLRSKTDYDVARVAQHFGGGGHAKAAGLSTEGPLSQAVGRIVAHLETLLSPGK
jgi:phosphoesterase RecJ-like protein